MDTNESGPATSTLDIARPQTLPGALMSNLTSTASWANGNGFRPQPRRSRHRQCRHSNFHPRSRSSRRRSTRNHRHSNRPGRHSRLPRHSREAAFRSRGLLRSSSPQFHNSLLGCSRPAAPQETPRLSEQHRQQGERTVQKRLRRSCAKSSSDIPQFNSIHVIAQREPNRRHSASWPRLPVSIHQDSVSDCQEMGGGVAGASNRLKKSVSAVINGRQSGTDSGPDASGGRTPKTPQQTQPHGSDSSEEESSPVTGSVVASSAAQHP